MSRLSPSWSKRVVNASMDARVTVNGNDSSWHTSVSHRCWNDLSSQGKRECFSRIIRVSSVDERRFLAAGAFFLNCSAFTRAGNEDGTAGCRLKIVFLNEISLEPPAS